MSRGYIRLQVLGSGITVDDETFWTAFQLPGRSFLLYRHSAKDDLYRMKNDRLYEYFGVVFAGRRTVDGRICCVDM